MEMQQIELELIQCIRSNIEDSGDDVPDIESETVLLDDLENFGFDSLRAIEVLIDLEDVFKCELPPEKVFLKKAPEKDTINDIAKAIKDIVDQGEK